MNILLVSSKYPPEYSGSGNRISLLYERLSKKYNSISPSVICNSTEYKNSNESYIYKNINVSRVSSNIINRKPGLFYKLLKLVDIYIEFFQTLIIISKKNIDLIHVIGTSVSTTTAIFWANLKNIPLLIELVNTGAKPNQSVKTKTGKKNPNTGNTGPPKNKSNSDKLITRLSENISEEKCIKEP